MARLKKIVLIAGIVVAVFAVTLGILFLVEEAQYNNGRGKSFMGPPPP
jgi:hypothetical protein